MQVGNPPSPVVIERLYFRLAYIRNTACIHCRKMALPDTNDPHFFYHEIAADREEDEVVV